MKDNYCGCVLGTPLPPVNQCDGCRVNAPFTWYGNHKMPDGGFLKCTKERYENVAIQKKEKRS